MLNFIKSLIIDFIFQIVSISDKLHSYQLILFTFDFQFFDFLTPIFYYFLKAI